MSLVLENSTDLTSLGDAIRSKTGGSSNLTVAQMANEVEDKLYYPYFIWNHKQVITATDANGNSYGNGGVINWTEAKWDLTQYVEDLDTPNFVFIFLMCYAGRAGSNTSYYYPVYYSPIWANIAACLKNNTSNPTFYDYKLIYGNAGGINYKDAPSWSNYIAAARPGTSIPGTAASNAKLILRETNTSAERSLLLEKQSTTNNYTYAPACRDALLLYL